MDIIIRNIPENMIDKIDNIEKLRTYHGTHYFQN